MAAYSIGTSSSMLSPSFHKWKYDVFLSFRGEDTRKGFTDHLYEALVQVGINTFRDDEELKRGEIIRSELLQAIEESMISIVVFSKNYASSSWCLDELVKILECREEESIGHRSVVIPIFYDIDPCDVRRQDVGTYGEAFSRHRQRFGIDKVEKWKAALTQAANLSGWDLQNVADGHEAKFIRKLVEEVLTLVNPTYMHVPRLVIGANSHVPGVISLLDFYSAGVCMFGIYGMAGIGKTTVAKAVYNQIHRRYEGFSFVADVRERSENNKIHSLQQQLLSEVLNKENYFFKVLNNVDRGKCLIKERLGRKKVLIVLDDVDDERQIKALAEERRWFGLGSTIIITTRDKHLLDQFGVDYKYEVTRLDDVSSVRLFCFHAFKDSTVPEKLYKLVRDIADLGGGVPLALEVLGSLLHKKEEQVWRSTLESLKSLVQHDNIQKALKVSYDSLDERSKEIFLDIACFFIGSHQDYASLVLTGCGRFFIWGKGVLTERCLLKIEYNEYLWMHDLVRDMAREIVRQESLEKPHKRSRLWFHEDVCYVLEKNKGSKRIEGISVIHPKVKDMTVNTEVFARMDRLKILKAKGMHLSGSFKNMFVDLRWLSWQNFPLKCLPTDVHLSKLVALDMQYSNITDAWQSNIKPLECLRHVNISHCIRLKRTPDFSAAKSLETVLLEGCSELVEVHSSINFLVKLVHLNLKDCIKLKDLPIGICELESLQHLNLSGCSGLQQLPADLGRLTKLRILSLQGCNRSLKAQSWMAYVLSFVPWTGSSSSSISFLPHSISQLCCLTFLNLRDCRFSEADIPINLGSLSSLEYLDLGGNDFYSLPSSLFCHLSKLDVLVLDNCKNLQMLSQLPPNLLALHANDCSSIERLDMSNYNILPELYVSNCDRLSEIKGMETIQNVEYVRMESSSKLASLFFSESFFQLTGECDEDLPSVSSYFIAGKEVPEWFSNRDTGSKITLTMPSNIEHKFQGMIIWCVYDCSWCGSFEYGPVLEIGDQTNGITWVLCFPTITVNNDKRSWVSFVPRDNFRPSLQGEETITFSFGIREQGFIGLQVTKCGVHPVYAAAGKELPKFEPRDPRSNFEERRIIPLWKPSYIVEVGQVMTYILNNGTNGQHIQKVIFEGLRLISKNGDGLTCSFHDIIGTPYHVDQDNFRQILQDAYDQSRVQNTDDWRDLFCSVVVDQKNRLSLEDGCWNTYNTKVVIS